MNSKVYKKIAKKYGVSVKEVKREMQIAIDEAYKNPNFYALSIGEKPTVDEVVNCLSLKVKSEIEQ